MCLGHAANNLVKGRLTRLLAPERRRDLNPRPPDAEPARSAGVADAAGKGSAGASTPCDSLGGRVTTPSSDHARSWASVS